MTPAVEVTHISKTFKGGVQALKDVSFSIEAGTVFGLLGPNGAGKTTIVRILTTIIKPDSGSATVMGYDVLRSPALVREQFGLAGQAAAVDERLTAFENLYMIGRLNHLHSKEARSRARGLLDRFGLSGDANRVIGTYSGGMRRRVDLAAALVAQPPILFLDEPTTGLDPKSRNDLWEVIDELVEAGTTVLLTTQYLEEADRLSSIVAVVDQGVIVAQGTPAQLKARFGSTILELGFEDPADAVLAAPILRDRFATAIQNKGGVLEIPVREGASAASNALRVLVDHDLSPRTLVLREPSLDDVFLLLTGDGRNDNG